MSCTHVLLLPVVLVVAHGRCVCACFAGAHPMISVHDQGDIGALVMNGDMLVGQKQGDAVRFLPPGTLA